MDLSQILASISALHAALADAQAALDGVRKEGFDSGVASCQPEIESLKLRIQELESMPQPDPEKKYSQAELDQAVSDAVAAAVQPAVDAAVAAFKIKVQELHDQEEIDLETKLQSL